MLLTICTDVRALAIRLNSCTKRVVRVSFCLLQNLHFGSSRRLIGIEHNVHTIRKVVRINSHALQVMIAIHKDSNLRIMALTKVEIRYATANFHNAVLI